MSDGLIAVLATLAAAVLVALVPALAVLLGHYTVWLWGVL